MQLKIYQEDAINDLLEKTKKLLLYIFSVDKIGKVRQYS